MRIVIDWPVAMSPAAAERFSLSAGAVFGVKVEWLSELRCRLDGDDASVGALLEMRAAAYARSLNAQAVGDA